MASGHILLTALAFWQITLNPPDPEPCYINLLKPNLYRFWCQSTRLATWAVEGAVMPLLIPSLDQTAMHDKSGTKVHQLSSSQEIPRAIRAAIDNAGIQQCAGSNKEADSKATILFIDAYDSFTNNIISLLSTTLSCNVRVLRIDDPRFTTRESLIEELQYYDAAVVGPGPGHPAIDEDVGIGRWIWELEGPQMLPVLGICLGFQSLGLACGAKVRKLEGGGCHGLVKRVLHRGEALSAQDGIEKIKWHGPDIYRNVGEVHATLYQSLCVDIGQSTISVSEWESRKWQPSLELPDLVPLAWVEDQGHELKDGKKIDRRILVASRHRDKPFWALQYHPESICTNEEGKQVIVNWMEEVQLYNGQSGRRVRRDCRGKAGMPVRKSLLAAVEQKKLELNGSRVHCSFEDRGLDCAYQDRILDLPRDVQITDILELLQSDAKNQILLQSSNEHIGGAGSESVRGRYSIIALNVDEALKIEYSVGKSYATVRGVNINPSDEKRPDVLKVGLNAYGGIWPFLASYLASRRIQNGASDIPFWGGFMGYTTYELGLECISIETHGKSIDGEESKPDLNFAWITESIVVDHKENKIHIQQLISEADAEESKFLSNATNKLLQLFSSNPVKTNAYASVDKDSLSLPISSRAFASTLPNAQCYESKVHTCKSHIADGTSYELCLTNLASVSLPKSPSTKILHAPAYNLYKLLRNSQPAPFASFLRLGSATFVSASPERFLTWDSARKCELRPMKGTVKKSAAPTRAEADKLLNVDKERAENLMIVDLVRHDLYGVCGAGGVAVEKLMRVEEYTSVWQMVSVVTGHIPELIDEHGNDYSGVDVLAASLPPGSMTGAPKKRSCEILRDIEGGVKRSLYSGVVGYMDVGGRGDWSVNIRCAFHWDGETQTYVNGNGRNEEHDTWYVGAGGAVTALSDERAEREEMETKLFNTLGILGLSPTCS
jgi:para-aminobenzoate synthetase